MSIFKTEILRLTLRTYDFPRLSTRFAVSSINFLLLSRCPVLSESERLYTPNLHITIAPAIASFLETQYYSTQGSLPGKTFYYFSP